MVVYCYIENIFRKIRKFYVLKFCGCCDGDNVNGWVGKLEQLF